MNARSAGSSVHARIKADLNGSANPLIVTACTVLDYLIEQLPALATATAPRASCSAQYPRSDMPPVSTRAAPTSRPEYAINTSI